MEMSHTCIAKLQARKVHLYTIHKSRGCLTSDSGDDPVSKMEVDQSSRAQFSEPWLLPSSETIHRITERPKEVGVNHNHH